ncbi:hypothetical protein ARMGADRAFT_1089767 [Armillaria gallica]|uniref:Uncharacterized protein n=1 Tax=Armillaria gallica TaxID=47427 RepID=A0A2H3CIV6_ARMGA|nr:hypothetical protein ARMGADRAFT_1089767 [Armillaria gallica]
MLIDPAPTKAMDKEELRKSLRLKWARGRGFGINSRRIIDTEDIALINWCEDENVRVGGWVLGGDGEGSRGFDGHAHLILLLRHDGLEFIDIVFIGSPLAFTGGVIAEGEVTMRSHKGERCRHWRNGREALEEWKERNIVAGLHEEEVVHSDEIAIAVVSLGWRLAGIWWLM